MNLLCVLVTLLLFDAEFCLCLTHFHHNEVIEQVQSPGVLTTSYVAGLQTTVGDTVGFLVSLFANGKFLCGGALLKPMFVISAAHCIAPYMDHLETFEIEGGKISLHNHKAKVIGAMIPPMYDDFTKNMDIGVLQLNNPLIGENIRTIKLCTHPFKTDDIMTLIGSVYRRPMTHNTVNMVHTEQLRVASYDKCRKLYKGLGYLKQTMFCSEKLSVTGICTVDAGGPLVHKGQLCGIVSHGMNCHKDNPGIYTNLLKARYFIYSAMHRLNESLFLA